DYYCAMWNSSAYALF
nr:immunoglobulin light chain junction region [Macaca mulatta]